MIHLLSKIENWLKNKSLIYILVCLLFANSALYFITEIHIVKGLKFIQCRKGTTGLSYDKAHKFVYFFYYTNYFPLTTNQQSIQYSKQAANLEIANNGNELMNEYKYWARLGENGRIFAFLPNAIISNSAENPSVKLFNVLFFISALIALYYGFFTIQKRLLGFLVVVFFNCSPFFIYEVYCNQNIFGLLGCTFFIILGITLPMFYGYHKKISKQICIAVLASIIIGFNSEIRNEVSIVLLSLLLLILFSSEVKYFQKALLLSIIVITFFTTKTAIQFYFDKKINESYQLVKSKKGHLYTGAYINGHQFWHPMICGLGDFDTKYGFKWDDRVAYNYAVPILQTKYKLPLHYSNKFVLDDFYDNEKFYNKKFDEIPEYESVVKDKFISTIKSDPYWYVIIILKRIWVSFARTLPLPLIGWLIFPLFYFLYKNKRWEYLKIIIISFPLSITPIVIFSGLNATYNGVYGFLVISILITEWYENKKSRTNI